MPGADSTAIENGFNWKREASELWQTALNLGKQYVSGRIEQKTAPERTAQAQQNEAVLRRTRTTRNILTLAVIGVGVYIAFKLVNK